LLGRLENRAWRMHYGIARSVRLSVPRRSWLGYRHAGCLQLSHHRPPEMCGLLTRPQTDINPPRFLDRTAIGGRGVSPSRPGAIRCFFSSFTCVDVFNVLCTVRDRQELRCVRPRMSSSLPLTYAYYYGQVRLQKTCFLTKLFLYIFAHFYDHPIQCAFLPPWCMNGNVEVANFVLSLTR